MSTPAVTSASLHQQLEIYFHTRQQDLAQLGKALQSGDLATAQQVYNSIVALGKDGPFRNGDPFRVAQREQDFQAIGNALQAGDLSRAQLAFTALRQTFAHPQPVPPSPVPPNPEPTPTAGSPSSEHSVSVVA